MVVLNEAIFSEDFFTSNYFLTSIFLISLVTIRLFSRNPSKCQQNEKASSVKSDAATEASSDEDCTSTEFIRILSKETNSIDLSEELRNPHWRLCAKSYRKIFALIPMSSLSEKAIRQELNETVLESSEVKLLFFLFNQRQMFENFNELSSLENLLAEIRKTQGFVKFNSSYRLNAFLSYCKDAQVSGKNKLELAQAMGILGRIEKEYHFFDQSVEIKERIDYYQRVVLLRKAEISSESLQSLFRNKHYKECIAKAISEMKTKKLNPVEFHMAVCSSMFERDEIFLKLLILQGLAEYGKNCFYFCELIYGNFEKLETFANEVLTVMGTHDDIKRAICLLGKSKKVSLCLQVFDIFNKRNFLMEYVILAALLDMFLDNNNVRCALGIYRDLKQNKWKLDALRLINLISLSLGSKRIKEGVMIFEENAEKLVRTDIGEKLALGILSDRSLPLKEQLLRTVIKFLNTEAIKHNELRKVANIVKSSDNAKDLVEMFSQFVF